MSTISVTASGFAAPYAAVNGTRPLNASRQKCIKFASTVGLSDLAPAVPAPAARLALAVYRAMAVRCALDFGRPVLRIDAHFRRFETTEKANISYWIGMMVAGLVAADVLGVPRLIHAQQTHGVVKLSIASRSLADLVGPDSAGAWHVVEAKARQARPSAADLAKWKNQARTISHVGTSRVATNSYCYATLNAAFTTAIIDPPPRRPIPVALRIDPAEFGSRYYEPLVRFLGRAPRVVARDDRTFSLRVIAFDPLERDYVYVGLDQSILDSFQSGKFPTQLNELDDKDLYVGSDGVAVMTSPGPCDN